MDEQEFESYIENNCRLRQLFYDKAVDYENEKNDERAKSKKFNSAEIRHTVDRMYKVMISTLYEQIRSTFKNGSYKKRDRWTTYMENNDTLTVLEDSMIDLEFEE